MYIPVSSDTTPQSSQGNRKNLKSSIQTCLTLLTFSGTRPRGTRVFLPFGTGERVPTKGKVKGVKSEGRGLG